MARFRVLQPWLLCALLTVCLAKVYGGDETLPPGTSEAQTEVDEDLANLLAILEEQTEIATKSKMNADFVPGIVTVLYGDNLEAVGVRTVWEALSLVPGFEPSISRTGARLSLVRGTGGTFSSGNLKVLLNDISINSSLNALSEGVLNMPIELVDRIEVIRGPGSAIHGEYAYSGVVNVVTRTTNQQFFLSLGEFDTAVLNGVMSWSNPDKGMQLSVDVGGWDSDGADAFASSDILTGVPLVTSQAPGPANEDRTYRSAIAQFSKDAFSLVGYWLESGNGDHFGTVNALPAAVDRIAFESDNWGLELRQSFEFGDDIELTTRLGISDEETRFDLNILPANYGFWFNNAFQGPFFLPDGYLSKGFYESERIDAGVDLGWRPSNQHVLLIGITYAHIDVGDAWQENNIHPLTGDPLAAPLRFEQADGLNWVVPGAKRNILSVTLQDEFEAHAKVTITAGIRFDDYSDFGNNLSPRIAAVYRLNQRHVFKGQFATAFRPPTFFETAWSEDIEAETIETAELSHVYRDNRLVLRSTFFYSSLDDLIIESGPLGFTNSTGARLKGLEFEVECRFRDWLKWSSNATLFDKEDAATSDELADSANFLVNAYALFQPLKSLTFAVKFRHVGERERQPGDSREPLDGYQTWDLSASAFNVGIHGLSLRAGIQNVFDEDVKYPAPPATYADDYLRAGSEWWLKVAYKY